MEYSHNNVLISLSIIVIEDCRLQISKFSFCAVSFSYILSYEHQLPWALLSTLSLQLMESTRHWGCCLCAAAQKLPQGSSLGQFQGLPQLFLSYVDHCYFLLNVQYLENCCFTIIFYFVVGLFFFMQKSESGPFYSTLSKHRRPRL